MYIIKNGTIITASEIKKTNIIIENGKIKKITKKLPNLPDNFKIIDAKDRYIFPGGIDPHVHLNLPVKVGYSTDDFYTGSKAALFGGTTSIIDFVTPRKGQSLIDAFNDRKKEAENSIIDYSFHVSPIERMENIEQEIKSVHEKGINSFKLYTTYRKTIGLNYDDIYKVMQAVAKISGIVTVHCECDEEINYLQKIFTDAGYKSVEFHQLTRPDYVELLAIREIIRLANETKCKLYIVHISAKKSVDYIKKVKQKSHKIFVETCPQYLIFDKSEYQNSFKKSASYVFSPPLRTKDDNKSLWKAINSGEIQIIATDHCPFNSKQKYAGINDFREIPGGAGGIEHRLPLLFTFGVLHGKITLNQFVNLTSTQAAKIFGLYPQKGEIAEGSDADLIIWDYEKSNIISAKTHHQNCDINIYEGIKTFGEAEYVISGGEILIKKGKLIKEKKGKFLKTVPNTKKN